MLSIARSDYDVVYLTRDEPQLGLLLSVPQRGLGFGKLLVSCKGRNVSGAPTLEVWHLCNAFTYLGLVWKSRFGSSVVPRLFGVYFSLMDGNVLFIRKTLLQLWTSCPTVILLPQGEGHWHLHLYTWYKYSVKQSDFAALLPFPCKLERSSDLVTALVTWVWLSGVLYWVWSWLEVIKLGPWDNPFEELSFAFEHFEIGLRNRLGWAEPEAQRKRGWSQTWCGCESIGLNPNTPDPKTGC